MMASVSGIGTAATNETPKAGWLTLLCITRMFQATVATVWAGILPRVMAEWGLAASSAGLVQSAWHVGYLVSLFGVGLVADRIGARLVFLASSVLTALAATLFALGTRGPASAALLYGLTGLCAGGCYSPGLQLLAANALPARRGRAMGAFIGASSLGYGLSLVVVAGLANVLPWRSIVLVVAAMVATGAVLTVCALTRMRPDPLPTAATAYPVGRALSETLRDKPAMTGNAAYAAHCWELMALWAWLPAFLAFAAQGGGLSAAQGIALAAAAHLVSVAGSVLGGAASDRHGRARVMMVASCASLLCSFTFGWLWAAPVGALAVFGALYNLWAIADSSVYSTALADVVPAHRLGAAFSVRSVMGFGAGAISPWVFGMALDWGQAHLATPGNAWGWAWSTVGLGALCGPWMIWRFQRLVTYKG
ncbi:MAG: MFS transporter [Xylophilus ampelinus]